MHIALNGWFWGQLTTGSGQYLHHLVQRLPEIAPQHEYTLLLPRASASGADAQSVARFAPPPVWRAERVGTPFDRLAAVAVAKTWFEQVAFPLACRRLGVAVAHVPYWGSPWWRPCRVVVTVHDLIPLLLPAYRGGLRQRLYTRLVAHTARRAALILTDSQASRQDIIQRLGVAAERVQTVLLAADERFRPVTGAAELRRVREKYSLPERFILYLGGFDVRKNVPLLLRAYARFLRSSGIGSPSCSAPRLVIAGKLPAADTAFAPDPRRIVAEEGIGDWVHFTGWVDEADKPALYSLAELFAFPSAYEGFGLPVLEARRCGAPVVTSRSSSLPEAAPDAALVEPGNVESLVEALAGQLGARRNSLASVAELERTWADVARETHHWLVEAVMTR